ncbi:MAG: GspH/FimT family pseudopilin [Planctomycetes bacterium]|nr:GspH/FimT family pseudopilin [Planctomycetota bacterium]
MEIKSSDNLVQGTGLHSEFAKDAWLRGFTLVEIIIVIVIISIAAAMVVPMMSSADDIQLRSAANKLAADIEYAKSMAISRGQRYTVVFDETAESYQIEDSNSVIIDHPVRKDLYIEQFGGTSRLSKVEISDADFDGADSVTFDSIGCPDNGGTVTLTAGDNTIDVNVEAVTGYISTSN